MLHRLKSPLGLVFCIILIDVLGIGILIPVIPLLLTDPSYPYHLGGITVSQGYVLLGLLTAIYPLAQLIATPILGQLSDHVGRRPVLAFSLLGTALSYVVFAIGILTKNLPLLFASRALDGITGGNISVAQAAVADSSTHENRAKSFGIIGAAFGIGFVIGPFLGGRLADPSLVSWFDATTPFWFAAIISLANAVAVFFLFEETLKARSKERMHYAQALINIGKAFTARAYRSLFTVAFLFQSGFAFFTTFIGAYLIFRFGFTQGAIGDFFAIVGICIALTQIFVTGFAAKRFTPYAIVSAALLGATLTILAFTLAPSAWMLYLIIPFQAVSVGLIMANLTALISRSAPPEEQGRVLGINASVQALAQGVPPAIGGFIAAGIAPAAPLMTGSVIAFAGFLCFVLLARRGIGRAHPSSHAAPQSGH